VKAVPRGYAPDVASNGSDFLIVAVAPSATTVGARNVVAVPVTGGAPGAAEVVVSGAAGAPRVASDGQGYAAIWSLGTAVQGAMRGGGVWLPVHGFGSGQGGSVAGRSGEYVFAWVTNSPSGDVSHVRSSGSGATWAWGSQGYGSQYGAEVEVSSGSSGFFVVARSTAGMVDGWTVVGGVKGATISVGYGQWPCSGGLRTASSGARFLVGWNCSNSLATAETDGVTAPTSVAHRTGAPGLTPTALGFAIAGGRPGSFRLLYSWGDQFNVANVFRRDSAAGAWGSTGTVDQRPQATQATVAVAWDGGAYLALWGQTTTASPIVDDLVAWWAF
jgi:hypothetical protein